MSSKKENYRFETPQVISSSHENINESTLCPFISAQPPLPLLEN